jgi:hypothetical protein
VDISSSDLDDRLEADGIWQINLAETIVAPRRYGTVILQSQAVKIPCGNLGKHILLAGWDIVQGYSIVEISPCDDSMHHLCCGSRPTVTLNQDQHQTDYPA